MHDLPIHPRLRHPLTGEPLRAVGHSRRGPIWPIIGAADDPPAGDPPPADPPPSDPPAGDPPKEPELSDAGKRAIAEERDARKAEKRRADAAEAELEKLRNASKSEAEKAVDAARKEGESTANERWKSRVVSGEIRAAAAALKFHDPRDAVVQLQDSLGEIKVADDGEVDGKAIEKLLADLKTAKPYLVDDGKGTASARDAGLGAAGNGKAAADVQPGMGRIRHAYETSGK